MMKALLITALLIFVSIITFPQNIAPDKDMFSCFEVYRNDFFIKNKINAYLKTRSSFYKPDLISGEDTRIILYYDDYGNKLMDTLMRKENDDWIVYLISTCTYDSTGNILSDMVENRDQNILVKSRRTTCNYDQKGKMLELKVEDWSNNRWYTLAQYSCKYNESGKLNSIIIKYWGLGKPVISTEYYFYDELGNVIKKFLDVTESDDINMDIIWEFGYANNGKMLNNYSSVGRFVYIYDNVNRLVSSYSKRQSGFTNRVRYVYDDLNNSMEIFFEIYLGGEWKKFQELFYQLLEGNAVSACNYNLKDNKWITGQVPRIYFNNGNDYLDINISGKVEIKYEMFPRKVK